VHFLEIFSKLTLSWCVIYCITIYRRHMSSCDVAQCCWNNAMMNALSNQS